MEKISYEDASRELNSIIEKIESGSLSMEEVIKLIARAKTLIAICYKELDKAKGKLTEIRETLDSLEEIWFSYYVTNQHIVLCEKEKDRKTKKK